MNEELDLIPWMRSLSRDEFMTAVRNEILNCNQTTRTNVSYILNELYNTPPDMAVDMRLIEEYVERLRSTADRITAIVNAATVVYEQLQRNSKR